MYSWLLSLIHLNTMWSWLKNGIPRRPKKAEMLVFLLKILYFSSIVFGNCHVLGVCSFRGWLLNPLEKWRTGSSSGNHGHLFLESNGRFLSFNLPRMVVAACTFWVFLRCPLRKDFGRYRRSCWMSYSHNFLDYLIDGCRSFDQIKWLYVLKKATLLDIVARCWGFPFNLGHYTHCPLWTKARKSGIDLNPSLGRYWREGFTGVDGL